MNHSEQFIIHIAKQEVLQLAYERIQKQHEKERCKKKFDERKIAGMNIALKEIQKLIWEIQ